MAVVVNDLDVVGDVPPPPQPSATPSGPGAGGGPSPHEVAEHAERAWRRVAELGERVRAD